MKTVSVIIVIKNRKFNLNFMWPNLFVHRTFCLCWHSPKWILLPLQIAKIRFDILKIVIKIVHVQTMLHTTVDALNSRSKCIQKIVQHMWLINFTTKFVFHMNVIQRHCPLLTWCKVLCKSMSVVNSKPVWFWKCTQIIRICKSVVTYVLWFSNVFVHNAKLLQFPRQFDLDLKCTTRAKLVWQN